VTVLMAPNSISPVGYECLTSLRTPSSNSRAAVGVMRWRENPFRA
jgi:hypothetical protein